MNRSALLHVICVCALLLGTLPCAHAEPPPGFTRRIDPYFPPGPPMPEVSPETGLPLSWSTVGPEPFFGNPHLWGGGWGWGGWGWRGWGWGAFGRWGYFGGALGAYAPFGYGPGGSGFAYPRGPYWSAYRFGPYGPGVYGWNTGFGDPRYGANFAGPYHGFYGPAQRIPGYRTYGPYNPPPDAVVIPGLPEAQPQLAPSELPVPEIPQGP